MSEPIGPGDWVECVDARAAQLSGAVLAQGAVYRVVRIDPAPARKCFLHGPGCTSMGVELQGDDPTKPWWCGDRFRPIYRRRDAKSLTAKLLEGALSGVPAEVVREGSRETIKSGAGQ